MTESIDIICEFVYAFIKSNDKNKFGSISQAFCTTHKLQMKAVKLEINDNYLIPVLLGNIIHIMLTQSYTPVYNKELLGINIQIKVPIPDDKTKLFFLVQTEELCFNKDPIQRQMSLLCLCEQISLEPVHAVPNSYEIKNNIININFS